MLGGRRGSAQGCEDTGSRIKTEIGTEIGITRGEQAIEQIDDRTDRQSSGQ